MIARLATLIGVPSWAVIAALVALGIGGLGLAKCAYDRHVISQYQDHQNAKAIDARETAADERVNDAARDLQNEKDLHNAIETAPPGGTLSPAAHALACERLRHAGRPLPSSCRPASGNGAQAGSP